MRPLGLVALTADRAEAPLDARNRDQRTSALHALHLTTEATIACAHPH